MKPILAGRKMLYTLFVVLMPHLCAAQMLPFHRDSMARYITSRQFVNSAYPSYGAIMKDGGPALYVMSTAYYMVDPYFGHIACRGLLRSCDPNRFSHVKNWMNWYITHLNPDYTMYRYYYQASGTGETSCPLATFPNCNYIDAQDSDPSVFCGLAYEYFTYSQDSVWFVSAGTRIKLEGMINFVINQLMQPDYLCYAKTNYAVKFTMDNSEVYWGLYSLARIESEIYHDSAMASYYMNLADQVKNAIRTTLYNTTTGRYRFTQTHNITDSCWYQCGAQYGITAAIFPQLYGVDSLNDMRSIIQRQALNNNFDGSPMPDWTSPAFLSTVDVYGWPLVGYLFTIAGDTAKGFAQGNYLINEYAYPYSIPPNFVGEAGWMLMLLEQRFGPCSSLGIADDTNPEISIFPNPCREELHISGLQNIDRIELMDVHGTQLRLSDLSKNRYDVRGIPPGLYFLIILSGEKTFCQKLIVTD